MPLRTYSCPECGGAFDRLEPIEAPQESPCPRCDVPATRQVSAPGGLKFVGEGFYKPGFA